MVVHKPVLLEETIERLNLKNGDIVVDATLGSGGHSREILKKIGSGGKLIAIDVDRNNIGSFESSVISHQPKTEGRIFLVNDNFRNIEKIISGLGIDKVDAILADLGYSSDQLENVEYGMSFRKDGPLDMRLDREGELDASKVVNEYSEEDLSHLIKEFGEEQFAGRIAKKIVKRRSVKPIETTVELADTVREAIPARFRRGKTDPATKTFQAIRIEVNKELENLRDFLDGSLRILNNGGRLAVITFHSLEDRIVKNDFRENARGCICPSDFPKCVCGREPAFRLITRKPAIPDDREIEENPRSRSAKLRVAEKI